MRARHDESGFTVVEVMITTAISLCVMATMLGMLTSQTNAAQRVQNTAASQEDVRLAYVELVRDLRAAEPVLADPAPTAQSVALDQQPSGAPARRVRWVLETSGSGTALDRYELDRNGVQAPQLSYRLAGAVAGAQVFTFLSQRGVMLTDPNDISTCATRVHVLVQARTNGTGAPLRWETDIDLRNTRLPTWC